jgi:hypothetical protein
LRHRAITAGSVIVTATGRPGFSDCGFEFVLRTDPGRRVEATENDDGSFVRLAASR